jgi:DNA repair protein RecO (recombination protein O)
VVRVVCEGEGVIAAYVWGAQGRSLRPVLQPGNVLAIDLAPRPGGRLPVATPHLIAANMAMLHGPAALALVAHLAGLAAALLPEGVAQPLIYPQLAAVMAAAGAGASAHVLGAGLVRLELALLAELGVGLDLASCAATGVRDDLAYVSPRSRQAVSRSAGLPYAARLLPLPAFLLSGGPADAAALADGLALAGHFLARDALAEHPRRAALLDARARLVALLLAGAGGNG